MPGEKEAISLLFKEAFLEYVMRIAEICGYEWFAFFECFFFWFEEILSCIGDFSFKLDGHGII